MAVFNRSPGMWNEYGMAVKKESHSYTQYNTKIPEKDKSNVKRRRALENQRELQEMVREVWE
jgi:hypothetical protein